VIPLAQADREIIAEIWTASQAWRTCREIVEAFPHRYGGHPQEAAARDFVAAQLRASGLAPGIEEFPCRHWRPGRARLAAITASGAVEIPCVNLPMNGRASIDAEAAYVEEGTPAQYQSLGDRIRGRIVVANSRCPAYTHHPRTCRREKYLTAVAGGAAGFVYMRHEGGLLPEVYNLSSNGPAAIPGVSVTREAGATLLHHLRLGARVHLEVDNDVSDGISWNVVADLPGSDDLPVILVGAHYDALIGCPGAIDDASGAAVMLEAARMLSRHRGLLRHGVRFVAFGLEEGGLLGAHAYVKAHQADLHHVAFMLNVDGAAYGAPEKGVGLQGWPELIPYFKVLASQMGEEMTVDVWVTPNSDMHPFMLAGVPCAWFFDMGMSLANLGWPHTAADTMDKISQRGLRLTSLQLTRLLLHMAATPMPAVARSRSAVDTWLSEWNLAPRTGADQ
jgi:Zn-dependent M28 family amino/carboxypeptidase